MSVIEKIDHEITKVYPNDHETICEKYITVIIKVNPKKHKSPSIIMRPPKMLTVSGEELPCKNYKSIEHCNRLLSLSINNLRFEYTLGDANSFLDTGFKLVIEYKLCNENFMAKETYVWNGHNNIWERENIANTQA